mmetsp:Transcript_29391/g.80750  ORF Transcript_29391/g.80750 Transcript_29391/m.80750 type:complete len:593 (-) Transcript_29391:2828-4606(-)
MPGRDAKVDGEKVKNHNDDSGSDDGDDSSSSSSSSDDSGSSSGDSSSSSSDDSSSDDDSSSSSDDEGDIQKRSRRVPKQTTEPQKKVRPKPPALSKQDIKERNEMEQTAVATTTALPKFTSGNTTTDAKPHPAGGALDYSVTQKAVSKTKRRVSKKKSSEVGSKDVGQHELKKKKHNHQKGKIHKGSTKPKTKQKTIKKSLDDDDDDDTDMSMLDIARLGYQELVNAIIRPPRTKYKMEELGPLTFVYGDKEYSRTDFELVNKRGHKLQCSKWYPSESASDLPLPAVIYLHGNSSGRTEVVPQCLPFLLSLGVWVVTFDFAGSGMSDGEYVSLGYYEQDDLSCVTEHLRSSGSVSKIVLWGRSMGAATALLYATSRDASISGMILDSPFSDLTQLFNEMVEKARDEGIAVPGLIASVALRMLRGSVKKQAGFNMKDVRPIANAENCWIPALFVAGEKDDFVRPHHSKDISEKYAGKNNLLIVPGTHSTARPTSVFDSAVHFLKQCLKLPSTSVDMWQYSVPANVSSVCPPWLSPKPQSRTPEKPQVNAVHETEQDIGMTNDRQRKIEASLFKMLGQSQQGMSCRNLGQDHES